MKRFCQECGIEAAGGHKICTNCGVPLQAEDKVKSHPMSKKQKLILQIVGAIVVFIVGFSMWANSYQSPQSVEKRFKAAVTKEDSAKIKRLMVHEDGSAVSVKEAEAFLKLAKEEGKSVVTRLTSIAQHGKFLGIYGAHKIEAIDQFVYYDRPVDGLTFQFNGENVVEHIRNDNEVVHGPMLPGIYDVTAIFKGEYGETSSEGSVTLANIGRDYTWIGLDIPVSNVIFYINNHDDLDVKTSFIKINETNIPINGDGQTAEVGPFVLDGTQEVQTVVSMPWGEVISSPIKVDSTYMNVRADVLSDEQYSSVVDTLKEYGEQNTMALAALSTDPLTVVTPDFKVYFEKNYLSNNRYYTGSFEKLEMDKDSLRLFYDGDNHGIALLAQHYYRSTFHELTEEPVLWDWTDFRNIKLHFDKEKKQWLVNRIDAAGIWGGMNVTDTIAGSKAIHGPSEETIAQAKTNELHEEVADFVQDYTEYSVRAINMRDFYYVEDYITTDGPRWKEASDYIEYLDSKGITEELLSTNLEKVEPVDENSWKVTSIEEFRINKPDSSDVKKFRTTILVKRIEGILYVHQLISTKEI